MTESLSSKLTAPRRSTQFKSKEEVGRKKHEITTLHRQRKHENATNHTASTFIPRKNYRILRSFEIYPAMRNEDRKRSISKISDVICLD